MSSTFAHSSCPEGSGIRPKGCSQSLKLKSPDQDKSPVVYLGGEQVQVPLGGMVLPLVLPSCATPMATRTCCFPVWRPSESQKGLLRPSKSLKTSLPVWGGQDTATSPHMASAALSRPPEVIQSIEEGGTSRLTLGWHSGQDRYCKRQKLMFSCSP